MNKLLKLTGVSVVAIMTAMGANAAGYTCEELIEYTSCNDGYVLTSDDWTGKCVEVPTCNAGSFANASCPDGYWLATGVCENQVGPAETKEKCDEYGGTWYDVLCALNGQDPDDTTGAPLPVSYACSACPATGLTDKDGKTVVATTAGAGATSPAACYVGSEYYFTDTKGTYHYTDDCKYSSFSLKDIKTETDCEEFSEAIGEGWGWDGSICAYYGNDTALAPTTQENCEAANGEWYVDLQSGISAYCECMTWGIRDGALNCVE